MKGDSLGIKIIMSGVENEDICNSVNNKNRQKIITSLFIKAITLLVI